MVIVLHCSIGYVHMCTYTSTPNIYTSYVMYVGLFSLCLAKTTGNCVVFKTRQITCSQYSYIFLILYEKHYGYRQGTNNAHPLVIFPAYKPMYPISSLGYPVVLLALCLMSEMSLI